MNKKGFTLVELLAVLVILAIIMTIAVSSVGAIRKNMNIKMTGQKLSLIIERAKDYGEDHKDDLYSKQNNSQTPQGEVSVQVLLDEGYLDTDDTDSSGRKIIKDNRNDNSLNGVIARYYLEHDRVYACIPITNRTNFNLISNSANFANLHYFCE